MKKSFSFLILLLLCFRLYAQHREFKRLDSTEEKLYSSFFQSISPYDSVWAVEIGIAKGKGSIGFIKFYKNQIRSGCFISGSIVNNYLGGRGITAQYPFLLFIDTLSKETRKRVYNEISKAFDVFKVNKILSDTCLQAQGNIDDAPVTIFLKANNNKTLLLDFYAFDETCVHYINNKKLAALFAIKQAIDYIKACTKPEEKLKLLFVKLSKQNKKRQGASEQDGDWDYN